MKSLAALADEVAHPGMPSEIAQTLATHEISVARLVQGGHDDAAELDVASTESVVQPSRSEREVIVEYAAHPQARLYVGEEVYEVSDIPGTSVEVAAADRPVRLQFLDAKSGTEVAVRLHLHGAAGEYLPPRGYHRKVNRVFHQDNYAEFASGENQYVYVDGECIADLPLGTVYVEISRGYEIEPSSRGRQKA